MSVAKGPGQIALHVTPLPAHSSASTRVRPRTPDLDDAYGARPGKAITERIDPRLMMRPHPRSAIPGPMAFEQRNGPLRFVASTLSQSASDNCSMEPRMFVPALFTRMSMGPHARTDRKSTRLNSSHGYTSYAVFCLQETN